MARFSTAVLTSARGPAFHPSLLDGALALVPMETPSSGDAAVETAAGPGWFESSRDLQHGLEVREGLPSGLGWRELRSLLAVMKAS